MARKMTDWLSKRGPITKIMPSDGCKGDTVTLAVGRGYNFHEFGCHLGNIGSAPNDGPRAKPNCSNSLIDWQFGRFLSIQTHPSCRFLLAVDSLGLRRSGSSSQFTEPPQEFPKQVPGHGDFGQLERDVAAMAHDLGPDLDHP